MDGVDNLHEPLSAEVHVTLTSTSLPPDSKFDGASRALLFCYKTGLVSHYYSSSYFSHRHMTTWVRKVRGREYDGFNEQVTALR
jgi:hypothetical protein